MCLLGGQGKELHEAISLPQTDHSPLRVLPIWAGKDLQDHRRQKTLRQNGITWRLCRRRG